MKTKEDDEGTREMFAKESRSRQRFFGRFTAFMADVADDDIDRPLSVNEIRACKQKLSNDYFSED